MELGQWKIINPPGLRWFFVRIQGVSAGAYFMYLPAGTTRNPDKKTIKTMEFIFSTGLNSCDNSSIPFEVQLLSHTYLRQS